MSGEITPKRLCFIFDVGGVVVKWKNNDPIYRFVADRYDVSFGEMRLVMREGLAELESGRVSTHDYLENSLGQVGRKMRKGEDADWLMTFPCERIVGLRKGTTEVIKMLRRTGYKAYVLTNTCRPHAEMAKRLGWDKLFDGYFASCAIGAVKPSKEAYRRALWRIGALPSDAVFIDNNEDCVKGAMKAGIKQSFQFRSVLQLRRDVNEILRGT